MKLPQLSLRELFLLVALVAMALGWWLDRSEVSRQRDAIVKERESAVKDATRLAYYWDWFSPSAEPHRSNEPTHQWRQFQTIRERYVTAERPYLGDD